MLLQINVKGLNKFYIPIYEYGQPMMFLYYLKHFSCNHQQITHISNLYFNLCINIYSMNRVWQNRNSISSLFNVWVVLGRYEPTSCSWRQNAP